jgi:hypothetical protein
VNERCTTLEGQNLTDAAAAEHRASGIVDAVSPSEEADVEQAKCVSALAAVNITARKPPPVL